jgi:hypothetical protein
LTVAPSLTLLQININTFNFDSKPGCALCFFPSIFQPSTFQPSTFNLQPSTFNPSSHPFVSIFHSPLGGELFLFAFCHGEISKISPVLSQPQPPPTTTPLNSLIINSLINSLITLCPDLEP